MAILNRKQRKIATSIQYDKPSTSFKQSRKSRKLDFENVICVLELEPEDSGHKLLSALTNKIKICYFTSMAECFCNTLIPVFFTFHVHQHLYLFIPKRTFNMQNKFSFAGTSTALVLK